MELQRKNSSCRATPCTAFGKDHPTQRLVAMGSTNAWISSSKRLQADAGARSPKATSGSKAKVIAIHMHDCIPPTEQRSEAHLNLRADGTYHLANGATEMGNGTITTHAPDRRSDPEHDCVPDRYRSIADTDRAPYDTGTFSSVGTSVSCKSVSLAAEDLRDNLLKFASDFTSIPLEQCRLVDDAVECGVTKNSAQSELFESVPDARHKMR